MKVEYRILIVAILSFLYAGYTISVYATKGVEETDEVATEKILAGKMLWQKHNCQSCHQLYGLGGYLGPDLTNCYSAPHKGPVYMDAILQSGIGIMPDFGLDSSERNYIICFLKQMDASGFADPKKFTTTFIGDIYPNEAK
jgi:nitric oxide reductase subunit C